MATAIFWSTRPTKKSRPIANLPRVYVFHPIWMEFAIWTNIGQKAIENEFKMATDIFWPTTTKHHHNSIGFKSFIELFCIILLTFQYNFKLLTLFCCSYPHPTWSNHHHHPNFLTFFHMARAAFCGNVNINFNAIFLLWLLLLLSLLMLFLCHFCCCCSCCFSRQLV